MNTEPTIIDLTAQVKANTKRMIDIIEQAKPTYPNCTLNNYMKLMGCIILTAIAILVVAIAVDFSCEVISSFT
jgi:hypothetical protein